MFRPRRFYSSLAASMVASALIVVACAKRDADLMVSTDAIDFGSQATEVSFTVTNGGEDTGLTNGVTTLDYEITDNQPWLTVQPAEGTCGEGQTNTHVARIDRSALILGNNVASIEIESNGGSWTIDVVASRIPGSCTDPPTEPWNPTPTNGGTSVSVDANLLWSEGNSVCGLGATYQVYFGTTSPPPLDHDNGTSKTWDPGPLAYGTTYYWRIVAVDENGSTSGAEWSFTTANAPCTTPPTAPATPNPGNGATVGTTPNLSWSEGESQCSGLVATYDVYFGTTNPPPFSHSNGTSKMWNPGSLQYATTYYWRVVAKDPNGDTSGLVWSFDTQDAPCVVAPTAVTLIAPANGASNVTITQDLSWSGGDSQCPELTATYNVYFGTTSPPPFDHNNGTGKSWDPGTLSYSTTYYWRIVATDGNGETSSSERAFTTQAAPCTAGPTAVTLTAPTSGATNVPIAQDLSWSGGDSQCTGLTATYDVYFGTTTPPPLARNDETSKSWDPPGNLQYSTTYYWRVVATDPNGSMTSFEQSFTTVAAPCTAGPTAVALTSPANGATGQPTTVTLSWSGGDSQCPGLTATYDVYFGTSSTPPLDHNNGSTKGWTTGTLVPETTYYWRIVATDANGQSSSGTRSFTTQAAPCTAGPTAVTLVSPAGGATDVPIAQDLSWSGGDSQCPGLTATYDVYFGTTNPPPVALNDASAKTWDPGTLQYSTTYYWRVISTDPNGSASSSIQSFTTVAAPCTAGPTAVALVSPANGATDVPITQDLSWSGGDSQCPGLTATYDVYFGTAPSPPLALNDASAKTWDPGDLQNSTTYYWRVEATDANGSISSFEQSFTTAAVPCTDGPTAVTLTAPPDGATDVPVAQDLSWSGGDSQCSGLTAAYDVYFGTTSPPPLAGNDVAAKTYDPGSLAGATTYYWRVVATDANGSSSSEERSFTTAAVACTDPPAAVTLTSPANGSFDIPVDDDLMWTGGDSQCSGLTATYDVYFGTTTPPPLIQSNVTSKTYNPGDLSPNTDYYWRIVAVDANGSTSSETWSFATGAVACTDLPTTPAIVEPLDGASDVSIAQNLTWSGGDSQCSGLTAIYDIYFGTTSPPPFSHNNASSKTWDPGTLSYATTYFWQVVAKDGNGQTAGSVGSFTTEPCVAPPTVACTPTPTDGRTNVNENANLAWLCGDSQCPGLTATYDVYFGTNPTPGPEQLLGSTSTKAWALPTLQKETTFYWKIVTRDANGTTPGPIWSFTTRD